MTEMTKLPRFIRVDNCEQCPHKGHRGGFGQISYKPYCKMRNREIPYDVKVGGMRGLVTATPKKGIPNWCPLPGKENTEYD